MADDWIERFPDLASLPEPDRGMLAARASILRLPAGRTIFAPGLKPEHFLLVLDGTVRVQQVSAGGREIVLYRVHAGDSCIMTTACLFSGEDYSAEGVTETAVTAAAIPKDAFEDAIARSPGFRRIVFADYSHRISDLMHVVEDVAFARLDRRLARYLLNAAGPDGAISATHQDIASELGTAREVIGRLLKEFDRKGWVALGRGEVRVTEQGQLADVAARDN
ncbi:MAG: Crp/Fnr family transcriptional regulator [Rhodospirillales bacterium]